MNKEKLDVLIALERDYWKNATSETASRKLDRMVEFEKTECADMPKVRGLIGCIISGIGIKPDATNEDIYKVLEVLGWEVK